jgi:hypothetical protein
MKPFTPYRPTFLNYWRTIYWRFPARTIERHKAALMRGLVNRHLHDK